MGWIKWGKKIYELVKYIGGKVGSWGASKVKKMIAWVWNNKGTIYKWLERGSTIAWIAGEIYRRLFG